MPTSPATFTSNPQAKDDLFTNTGLTEDSLSGVKMLDVMGNDLGTGNTLYSLADGKGESDNRSKALLTQDAIGAVNQSALGAKIWITAEGKVAYDASALSTTQFQSLAAGQSATDSFTYAIKLSNGTLSWATAKVQITGINDAPVVDLSSLTIDGDSSSGKVTGTLLYTDPDKGDQHSAVVASAPLLSSAGAPNLSASLAQALRTTINDEGENGKGALKWNFALPSGTPKLATGQAVLANYQLSIADNHGGNSAAQDIGVLVVGTGATPKVYSVAARANLAEQAGTTGSTALDQASGTLSGNELGLEDKGGLTSVLVLTSWSTGGTIPSAAATILASAITTSTVPTSKGGESEKSIAWQFSAQDRTFDFLAAGEILTLAYRISSSKEEDGKSKIITLTVTGTNDAPIVATTDVTGAVTEQVTPAGNLTDSGTVTFTDVDLTDAHSISAVTPSAGALGTLSASVSTDTTGSATGGVVTWNYSVADSAVEYLAAGQTKVETFSFNVLDGQGGSVARAVDVTITGTNDAPIVAITDVTGAVTEQVTPAGNLTDSGTITFTDVDLTDAHSISAVTPSAGALGTLSASVSTDTTGSGTGGVVTWNYSVADTAVEYLAAGQTKVETFSFNVLDGQGGSVERTVSVTITGTNDAPVITNTAAALVGTVKEDTTLTAAGQLSASDVDHGATQTWSVQGSAAGTYGAIAVDAATGQWTYNLNNAATNVQALAAGETHTETFTVRVTDDQGAAVDQSVTVTLTGTNDAPVVATADVTGAVTEQVTPLGNLTDSGTVTFTDVDLTDAHSISAVTRSAGALGTLTASVSTDTTGSGTGGVVTWNYSVADSAVEYLAAGQTKVETFSFNVLDGQGGSVARAVDVTITGTNDAPIVATTDVTGAVTEQVTPAGNLTDSGTITFTDVDLTDAHSISAVTPSAGALGTLSASVSTDTTGSGTGGVVTWNYSVADTAVEYLAAGQTKVETFSFNVLDGQGASVPRTVSVTVTGTNDAPVARGDSNALTVTTLASVAHTNAVNWVDWTSRDAGHVYGTINLGSGQTIGVTYTGEVYFAQTNGGTDYYTGPAGTYTSSAVANRPTGSDIIALSQATQKTLTFSQPVNDLFFAVVSLNGNGYMFDQNFDILSYGQGYWGTGSATKIALADGRFEVVGNGELHGVLGITGAVQSLTWTSVSPETWNGFTVGTYGKALTATATGNVLTNDSDVDATDALAVSAVNGQAIVGNSITMTLASGAMVKVNSDGTYLYDENSAFSTLAQNATTVDSFQYTVKDGHGGTSTATSSITITGVNDLASITGTSTGAVTEDTTLTTSGSLTVSDVDTGQAFFQVQTNAAGAHGTFSINAAGQWTYALDNAAADVQALNAGSSLTDSLTVLSLDGTASQLVTVTIAGLTDNRAPVAVNDSMGSGTGAVNFNLLANDTDPDAGSVLSVNSFDALSAKGVTISVVNGLATMNTAGSAAYKALAAGQTLVDTFTYDIKDQLGAVSNRATGTYTLVGVNDAASMTGDVAGSVKEDTTLSTSGRLVVTDPDSGQSFATAQTTTGTYGTFTVDVNGNWAYNLNNSLSAVQALAQGETVNQAFTVYSQDNSVSKVVNVSIAGTNDAPVGVNDSKSSGSITFEANTYTVTTGTIGSYTGNIYTTTDGFKFYGGPGNTYLYTTIGYGAGASVMLYNYSNGATTVPPTEMVRVDGTGRCPELSCRFESVVMRIMQPA